MKIEMGIPVIEKLEQWKAMNDLRIERTRKFSLKLELIHIEDSLIVGHTRLAIGLSSRFD